MRGYFGIGQLSASDKQDILNQHKSVYNGYQTMQPQVSNTQPLYVYDDISDKEGFVVNNKGEVKKYTNMGINEAKKRKPYLDDDDATDIHPYGASDWNKPNKMKEGMGETCEQCGGAMKEDVCEECGSGYMEEGMGETCEQCGGTMKEDVCEECGSGYMEEETGHLDDIYHEEDLDPTAGFDYIQGSSNDVDTFEGMHKKLYKEDESDEFVNYNDNMDPRTSLERERENYAKYPDMDPITSLERERENYAKYPDMDDGEELFPSYDSDGNFLGMVKNSGNMHDSDFQDYESSDTQDGVDDPDNEDDGFQDINASEVTDGELEEINIADLIKGNKYKYNHPLHSNEFEYDSEHKYPEGEDMYGFRSGKTGYSIPGKHVKDYVSHLDDEDEVVYEIELDEYDADDMDVSDVKPAYDFESDGPGDVYPVNEFEDDDVKKYEQMESAFAEDDLEEGDIYGDSEFTETDVSGVQGMYGAMDRAYDFDSDGPGKAGPYQEFSYESELEEEEEFKEVDEDLKESFLIQKNKITEMFNRFNKYN